MSINVIYRSILMDHLNRIDITLMFLVHGMSASTIDLRICRHFIVGLVLTTDVKSRLRRDLTCAGNTEIEGKEYEMEVDRRALYI